MNFIEPGWKEYAQIDAARLGRQRWLDEHAAAAARGDQSAMSLAHQLVEEYEQFLEGLQLYAS